MSRYTLVNGLGLAPRAAIASSWLTAELRRVHGPHLIPMSARVETYKQMQRARTDHKCVLGLAHRRVADLRR